MVVTRPPSWAPTLSGHDELNARVSGLTGSPSPGSRRLARLASSAERPRTTQGATARAAYRPMGAIGGAKGGMHHADQCGTALLVFPTAPSLRPPIALARPDAMHASVRAHHGSPTRALGSRPMTAASPWGRPATAPANGRIPRPIRSCAPSALAQASPTISARISAAAASIADLSPTPPLKLFATPRGARGLSSGGTAATPMHSPSQLQHPASDPHDLSELALVRASARSIFTGPECTRLRAVRRGVAEAQAELLARRTATVEREVLIWGYPLSAQDHEQLSREGGRESVARERRGGDSIAALEDSVEALQVRLLEEQLVLHAYSSGR